MVEDLVAKANVENWVSIFDRSTWRFAGRLARSTDDRLSQTVLDWTPPSHRSRQRPRTRWSDSLTQLAGGDWMRVAANVADWSALEEGFVENL